MPVKSLWRPNLALVLTAAVILRFAPECASLQVQVMIASKWSHRDRRDVQRAALASCAKLLPEGHIVEVLFFLGDPNATSKTGSDGSEQSRKLEMETFGDMVHVGGPDSDPPVARDATYVLDRPCARTYRLAHGSRWLAENRPDLDYVMYLDDDSYLHLPRLMALLAGQSRDNAASVAMGFTMETDLDWSGMHICELCRPCAPCQNERPLVDFCATIPGMSLGACTMAIQNCRIFDDVGDDESGGMTSAAMHDCVLKKLSGSQELAQYFGSKVAPRWMLGMGWVFGSRIVRYLGRNALRLKVRGAADVMLGFWLAPLEGVHWVPMNDGLFHDHPESRSTFASVCSATSVLVHRLKLEHWDRDFDGSTCTLDCGEVGHT